MHNYVDTAIKALAFGGLGFAAGIVIGVLAGTLLAPQSGEQTREQLKELAKDASNSIGRLASEGKETVQALAERSKQLVG